MTPQECPAALRNPLKGLVQWRNHDSDHPFFSVAHFYVPWNAIEDTESDGLAEISQYFDAEWATLPGRNTKAIFRVYLHWPGQGSYWPADMTDGDFRADIRRWLPGDGWQYDENDPAKLGSGYSVPPQLYTVQGSFTLDSVAAGEYVLALAILDPAGMRPSVRFAIVNYQTGGRHPIGLVGVGAPVANPQLDPAVFADPAADRTLSYDAP